MGLLSGNYGIIATFSNKIYTLNSRGLFEYLKTYERLMIWVNSIWEFRDIRICQYCARPPQDPCGAQQDTSARPPQDLF